MDVDFRNSVVLAPLTKGGNLPFRRLCVAHGARITTSEMAYARQVLRGSRSELALLRRHGSEPCFGVQLAAGKPEEAAAAAAVAVERGAVFVDLNVGCPIHDVVRRGMGATLMRRPAVVGRIVGALVAAVPVPITVKLRTGWREGRANCLELGRIAEAEGAAAVTLHARSREQRYSKAADWNQVAELAAALSVPVIGNGDLLTHYEAERRRASSGCAGVMLARGALIKPWLFREIAERRSIEPSAAERVAVYVEFVGYLREHFGDDERGRERALRFLAWHLDFFSRYRPLPEAGFAAAAAMHPLMQTRHRDEEVPLLEAVLRDPRPEMHAEIAAVLWAADDGAAAAALQALGQRLPPRGGDPAEVRTAHG